MDCEHELYAYSLAASSLRSFSSSASWAACDASACLESQMGADPTPDLL